MGHQYNIEQRLRQIQTVLRKKYKVAKIGYFGSYTSGEHTEESDIDILVEFFEPVGLEFIELKNYLEVVLDRKIDLITEDALKPELKESILQKVIYQ